LSAVQYERKYESGGVRGGLMARFEVPAALKAEIMAAFLVQ
jgi:hypothetical protein